MFACALVALAILPAAARADGDLPALPVPAADQLMSTAHGLAVARWGMDPCGGQVTTTWAHMGSGINARSQWMSVDSADPSTYSDCSITYNLDVDWDWPKLCTVVEHELGHLSGHSHVDDPHDVMSPYYVYPTPECAAEGPGAAASAPAPQPRATQRISSRRASSGKRTRSAKARAKSAKTRAKSAKTRAKSAKTRAKSAKTRAKSAKARAKKATHRGSAHSATAASLGEPAQFQCTLF